MNDKEIPLNRIMGKVLINLISGTIEVLKVIQEDKMYVKVEISF